MDPTVIALAGTVFGGVGLKVAEHWLGRSKIKVDDAARLRDELRLEITALREEIKQLELAVDKWRDQAYKSREECTALQTELTILKADLANVKAENARLHERAP